MSVSEREMKDVFLTRTHALLGGIISRCCRFYDIEEDEEELQILQKHKREQHYKAWYCKTLDHVTNGLYIFSDR